jgi:TolB-like protein
MRSSGRSLLFAALCAATLTLGCASGPRLYVNPQADMTFYKKIAVLPFSNLSGETYAGDRVTRAFTTELIIADRFEIVDDGEFRAVLEKMGGAPNSQGAYDPQKLREAAAKVGATGLIRGAVTEYTRVRSGNDETPSLAFDVEMADASTNSVVWRTSIAKRGKGRLPVVGGESTRTFGRLVEEACREVVGQLEGKAF